MAEDVEAKYAICVKLTEVDYSESEVLYRAKVGPTSLPENVEKMWASVEGTMFMNTSYTTEFVEGDIVEVSDGVRTMKFVATENESEGWFFQARRVQ